MDFLIETDINMKELFYKFSLSIKWVLLIIISFLTPIIPLIIVVGLAIIIDTCIGIYRAYRLKEAVTSRKLSKLISKLLLYNGTIIFTFITEKYLLQDIIGLFTQIPLIATKLITTILLFIEILSITESYRIITGINVWDKLKSMIARSERAKDEINKILSK